VKSDESKSLLITRHLSLLTALGTESRAGAILWLPVATLFLVVGGEGGQWGSGRNAFLPPLAGIQRIHLAK
jgi:hypothetical protein